MCVALTPRSGRTPRLPAAGGAARESGAVEWFACIIMCTVYLIPVPEGGGSRWAQWWCHGGCGGEIDGEEEAVRCLLPQCAHVMRDKCIGWTVALYEASHARLI